MLDTFESFTPFHYITAGGLIALMAAASILGRRWRGTNKELRLRYAWAWFTIAWQIVSVAYWAWPTRFTLEESFPLHLCDVAAWVAPLALLTQRRTLRAILYFWAIGLSTQAFFTPVLDEGLWHPNFWFFWVGHTQIVGAAVYDVVALGYRPCFRDLIIGVLANLAFAAVVMPVNLLLDVNYGYIGNKEPHRPTLITRLGPWPLRLVWIALIVNSLMLLLWAVWPLSARVCGRRGTRPAPDAGPSSPSRDAEARVD